VEVKPLTDAQIRAEVEKAEARFTETYPDTDKSGPGKRATIRSMALRHVADKLDLKLHTVQSKYYRAGKSPRPPTKRERSHFDMLGVEVSESYRQTLGKVLSGVQSCVTHLNTAKQALARLAATQPFPEPKFKQWLGEFDSLYQRTKGMLPVGICPWCKNLKSYRDTCVSCYGTGYMLRQQQHAVPERLKSADVVIQGGYEKKVNGSAQASDRPPPPAEDPLPW
jgi:hypothetical protein